MSFYWARLCRDMPHRWYPVGNTGQLCLLCSMYRRYAPTTRSQHEQEKGWQRRQERLLRP